jgi:hypothetical protein
MKPASILAVLVVLTIAGWIAFDAFRPRAFAARAQKVRIGDSKEKVLAAMGRATTEFPAQKGSPGAIILGVHAETWAYGSTCNWQDCLHPHFPYFWPFRIRLFSPEDDDVAIEFDLSGKVSAISAPKL